jgi:CheY-like chemotaxis protein
MAGMVFVRGQGCAACGNTGYRGRIAVYEILKMDDTVRSVIAGGAPEDKIVQAARQGGFRSLLEDGLAKLAIGTTTAEELVRVIPKESVSVQARAAAPQLPPEPGARPAPPVSQPSGIRKEKILVVDDSRVVLQMLRMVLGAEMFEVVEATNGAEGLELVYRESPDLIITDVNMPTLDGLSFCKRLRERPQTGRIPIIMLTSQETGDHEVAGLEVGADDYIPKPVEPKRLLARVKSLLRRAHRSE